jgi:hypothetical protein
MGVIQQVPALRFLQLVRTRIDIGYDAYGMRPTIVNTGDSAWSLRNQPRIV